MGDSYSNVQLTTLSSDDAVMGKKLHVPSSAWCTKLRHLNKQGNYIERDNFAPLNQCCGSASIIMWILIKDPKNVHIDPDPKVLRLKNKIYTKKLSTKSIKLV